MWNLRLELGHHLAPQPLRTTEFAPAIGEPPAKSAPEQGYGRPTLSAPWKADHLSGQDFALQPDGTVRCPADKVLLPQEHRRERAGSLRIVYEARIADCRACPLREQCQWHGQAARHPRRVSVLLHPLQVGSHPLLWRDWPRRVHRRPVMQLLRHQRIEVRLEAPTTARPASVILSRAQRAHYRLADAERLARNARAPTAGQVWLTLFGVPEHFAAFLGLQAT